jgi:ribosome biogenesis GTPase
MHTEFGGKSNSPMGAGTSPDLGDWGWDDDWNAALAATSDPSFTPGRVSRIDRGAMTVMTESGARRARAARGLVVAVGDWVTIGPGYAADDLQVVVAVLPRRTMFRRLAEGPGALEQVVAANIDTVLLVNAIDGHLSVRHLERYLALAWRSGAVPVIVITKADLASSEQIDQWSQTMREAAPGVAIHVISTTTGRGVDDLAPYLTPGRTVALLGLSGAGKSTLVNVLAGAELLATGQVRSDGQGRHTTTHRELVLLPSGGLIIDTPGMRALSVWGAAEGVRLAFADVEALASRCEFPDCSHASEDGCAVRAAVAAGNLSAERLESWLAFREQPQALNRQADRLQVLDRKRRKATAKAARRTLRSDTLKAQRATAASDQVGPGSWPEALQ